MSIRSFVAEALNPGQQALIDHLIVENAKLVATVAELSDMLDDLGDQVTENEETMAQIHLVAEDAISRLDDIDNTLADPDQCFRTIIDSHTDQLDELFSRFNDQDGLPGQFDEIQGELDMLATAVTNRLNSLTHRISDDETVLSHLVPDVSDGWVIPGLVGTEDI